MKNIFKRFPFLFGNAVIGVWCAIFLTLMFTFVINDLRIEKPTPETMAEVETERAEEPTERPKIVIPKMVDIPYSENEETLGNIKAEDTETETAETETAPALADGTNAPETIPETLPETEAETVPATEPETTAAVIVATQTKEATTATVNIPVIETAPETTSDIAPETTSETTTAAEQKNGYLGRFKLTAYCACSQCCGKWGARTATGTAPMQGRTIAVDPKVIPYGSSVYIEGWGTYIAEDTGGAIKNNRIDIFFNNHTEALNFGVRYADVYLEP